VINIPQPVPGATDTDMALWKMRAALALQHSTLLDANLESAYALIRGQCGRGIQEKVEAQQSDFKMTHIDRDPIGLMALIKAVMFNYYNSRKYRAMAIVEIIKPSQPGQTVQVHVRLRVPRKVQDSTQSA
jgi:hypothetical protein